MGVCQITVVGNLGRDPELREAGSSTVCSFSIAHNRKAKGDEFTDWYNVDAWGKLGELCEKYLAKGRTAVVTGTLAQRAYETKDGEERVSLDIRATDVHFIGSAGESSGSRGGNDASEGGTKAVEDDDDIPF
jgi:single-strand DNA-binding protein